MPKRTTTIVKSSDQEDQEEETSRSWTLHRLRPRLYQFIILVLIVGAIHHYLQFQKEFLKVFNNNNNDNLSENTNGNKGAHNNLNDANPPKPVHILFGLAGNNDGFFAEFDVAFKSVLLNAPHHGTPLEIHIMADDLAYQKLWNNVWPSLFLDNQQQGGGSHNNTHTTTVTEIHNNKTSTRTTTLSHHLWYTQVTITTYNVQSYLESWKQQIREATKFDAVELHTIGAYFRLLCYHLLPPTVDRVFYIDTDVVIMANLAQVLETSPTDNDWFFQWSLGCSGVMIINVAKLPSFWDHVAQVDFTGKSMGSADQDLIYGVLWKFAGVIGEDKSVKHSTLVRPLPEQWDLLVSRDWKHINRTDLIKFRPQIGAIHYNGGSSSPEAYFRNSDFVLSPQAQGGWAIAASYYKDLPWSWVLYMGQSMGAGPSGGGKRYPIQISDYSTVVSS